MENQLDNLQSFTSLLNNLVERVKKLEDIIKTHNHDNNNSVKISFKNIIELIEVVSAAPTTAPTTPYGQIKLYINGATKRLYVYDYTNGAWLYSSLT